MVYTIPAWLLPLLVLLGVCLVAGWSSFKKMMEGFAGSAESTEESSTDSTDMCKKGYTTCIDASGSMTDCTAAYNKCMNTQGFTGEPVVAPTSDEPPEDVISSSSEHKQYMEEMKNRTVSASTPIPPTPEELTQIGGASSATDSYTAHSEGLYPHEMPRQTEGFSIQQMVRAFGQ